MSILGHFGMSGWKWLWAALPPALGYAEIHYDFKGVYSFLKHAFPEILADAPHRLEPGHPLPVTVLVKDAHQYPVHLKKIVAEGKFDNGIPVRHILFEGDQVLQNPWWHRMFQVPLPPRVTGFLHIDVLFEIKKRGKRFLFKNDNYRGTGHAPLKIRVSGSALPRFPGLLYGDLHTHSNFTSDQVEFGAPLQAVQETGAALGLDFVGVTDHSYDLDDCENNYLQNDPRLRKWKRFRREIAEWNARANQKTAVLIPGEEVTVRNARGRNVHFLVLNSRRFFKGTGDGAEKWFKFYSEHTIAEVLENLPPEAVAVAAHPGTPAPRLEYLLVNRGRWEERDLAHAGLTGLQIVNGAFDTGFREGLRLWKRALARGTRIFIFAGTDAHGNFNRYRQIRFPFFKMVERTDQILGEKRTALLVKKRTVAGILEALRAGRGFLTDGPALFFEAANTAGARVTFGENISGREISLTGRVLSSPEFGAVASVRLLQGEIRPENSHGREKILKVLTTDSGDFSRAFTLQVTLPRGRCVYFRLEASTKTGKRALSNPIWASA